MSEAIDKLKTAGSTLVNVLTNPAFTAFILLTWCYTIGMDLLVTISQPSWSDVQIWIDFGKAAIKDTLILFLAAISKILKSVYSKENKDIRGELKVISTAAISLMNKAMLSSDEKVRQAALGISTSLIGQGVTLYDHVFFGETDAGIQDICDSIDDDRTITGG